MIRSQDLLIRIRNPRQKGWAMPLFDVLGSEVDGPEGPVLVEATFASLPPDHGGPALCTRERFLGEVVDRHGRRWHAMIENKHARYLGPADE
ncbi:MAG: hypothetical protein CBB69_012965 [Phycisphaera sp. TMED9]|nr:MAG: hypothetical protein CBB69_012965 [Phycisphaera sp. TMED9]